MDQEKSWTIIRQTGNFIPAGDTLLHKPLAAASVTVLLTKQSLCFLPGGAITQSVKKEMWSDNAFVVCQEKVKICGEVALQFSFVANFDRGDLRLHSQISNSIYGAS